METYLATVTIQRSLPISQPIPISSVTLVLSEDEARALLTVVNTVDDAVEARIDNKPVYGVITALKKAGFGV